ncbi:cilia- and flagella-associated protein 418 [Syngnathoides biaculeatus]|uniref:cilia- and flagella-associated protein 418 n=1 Tax=Syngnathoides biaculeatus TaxID=300417 RepID=UPI002ADE447E|nr:cilia- and flagella-associated protein 418 [Syngnathoides biaculeatus]
MLFRLMLAFLGNLECCNGWIASSLVSQTAPMDDDLDELLDEVEKKFCGNTSVASDSRSGPKKGRACGIDELRNAGCEQKITSSSITEDVDSLLKEFQEEDYTDALRTKTTSLRKGKDDQIHCQSGGRKCCPIYLGGSATDKGVGTATSKRSCDQLRCTSCDFRVLAFDDCEWDSSCDYLFLRNNMPNQGKLGAKLQERRGVRAYACQCSWFTASDATDVSTQQQLRWACARHPD